MEIWKDVPNYEGKYKVSNTGKIASTHYGKHRVLKYKTNLNGYFCCSLHKNGIRKHFSVHRIVMMAFYGLSDLQVNHKDGNKKNNNIDNLEYCTLKENLNHALKTGLRNITGSKNGRAKLSENDVLNIRNLLKLGNKKHKIAFMYNVSETLIRSIEIKKLWKHL